MEQLLCHLIGDYILQNHWMAINKTNKLWVATIHGLLYTTPFLLIKEINNWSLNALVIICVTHILIDRFRIAAKLNQLKNWEWNNPLGFPKNTPMYLTVWVVILIDNTLHLLINYLALRM